MTNKKTGRNDPCPCGSGKKYKQCCLSRDGAQPANVEAMGAQVQRALHEAWLQRRLGNLTQAEGVCQQILQAMPNQPDALNLAGGIALQQSNLEVAIPLLQRAVKANPRHPEYYNNLGLAYHEKGELDAAEKHYRKALALAPEYTDAAFNLHALLLDSSNLQPAIQCLRQVLKASPLDNEARYTLGVLLDYGGDEAAAAQHFTRLGQGGELDLARLDAWRYLKSACQPLPPITGCGLKTFAMALAASPQDGMVLEFGVRFGTSIREIAALAKQPVHGFDSFEGLPEVWHHEPKGSYTTKGEIPEVPPNVSLHVGWFKDTLPAFLEQHAGPVRFVNVDCDIYSSTKTVLDLLASRMVAGSVIVFDEYIGNEHWREDEFKAFQEAVAKYGWSYEYLCFSIFTKQVVVRISSI